ncbi:CRISPR-associated protein, Csd1 family [Fibrobacter sp. UWH5]|uniref:type I-C CRISPR-associated protein Cas8c/Csd1 n=1 Tax=Fibrobacter sp. UWH5 TaxID=1896211 RepID=UPI00091C9FC9|nr:type I-C CRISPR-associated protein Cas8c/Csd1 [Fibrobacter sp. UWH5]SHL12886.1 CRISPR-associated protein, Csd1 family [Fibrobacter sp. UWH5]
MILQALNDYYVRKSETQASLSIPEGFEEKEISFFVVIDKNGGFVKILDNRELDGKKLKGRLCLVPSLPVGIKRVGKKIVPNLLWDSCDYALGLSLLNENDQNGLNSNPNQEKLEGFWNEIEKFNEKQHDCRLTTLVKFLKSNPLDAIKQKYFDSDLWNALKSSEKNVIGFSFSDDEFTPLTKLLEKEISDYRKNKDCDQTNSSVCLVTGEKGEVARLHGSIPKWGGGMASLVSFQKKSGYDSYGKEQAKNAPVSTTVTTQYIKALDLLINKQEFSNCRIGKTTICFWSKKEDPNLEENFGLLFWGTKDNPDKNILELKQMLQSVKTGISFAEIDNKFFVLGLEPLSKGRAAVRIWSENSYAEIQKKIKSYFEDIAIDSEDNIFPLNMYLRTLVLESGTPPKRSTEDLPPNLAADLMRAILNGSAFPQRILNSAIIRIRAECSRNKDETRRDNLNNIDCCRTALLKAYLNRKKEKTEKEITMSLDSTNTNQAYRLGRLFAAFEMLQRKAIGKDINATIKDRYYGAASSTPCTVFPQLFKLHLHHLEKVDQPIKNIYDNLIQDIMSEISPDGLPANLSLEDQARFAIGYYHQKLAIAEDIKKRVENKTGA